VRLREALATFRGHRVPSFELVGRRRWWFLLSGTLVAASVVGLAVRGLNFSIAFTGGSVLSFPNRSGAAVADYQRVMARFGHPEARVELLGGNEVSIRTESLTEGAGASPTPSPTPTATAAGGSPTPTATGSPRGSPTPTAAASPRGSPSPTPGVTGSPTPAPTATGSPTPRTEGAARADELRRALARVAGISPEEINEQDVGPTWGARISRKALQGLLVFLVLVTLYITLRFEWKMAVGALVALWHDIVITAGVYALVGREVTPETVIALLTILGYSLYDTVVIYDKVKENTESPLLVQQEGYAGVVNASLNQVLMRSVNTSLSTLLPIGALLLFGGQTLKDFAFALFVGVAVGGYSSIFVASPILAILKEREPRYRQLRARRALRLAPRPEAAPAAPAPRPELEPVTVAARPEGGRRQVGGARPGGPKRRRSRPQGKSRKRRR
jgi:preprotein translocase subunit SecF